LTTTVGMPSLRTFLVSAAAAALLLAAGASSASAARCSGARAVAAARTVSPARQTTICLVNAERARRGLSPLRTNRDLTVAAQRHSADMVRRGFFDHETPNGTTVRERVQRTGYLRGAWRWSLGENIGWAAQSGATPAGMVRAWMNSPGHRAIILNARFREAGVGIAMGIPTRGGSGATFTMDFGLASH
jgi:uncharacterized protein YkwD